jgi:hypothetical protein
MVVPVGTTDIEIPFELSGQRERDRAPKAVPPAPAPDPRPRILPDPAVGLAR